MELTNEDGEVVAETVFSALDILKVLGTRRRWHFEPEDGRVRSWIKVDGKETKVLMHRYIIDAPDDMLVDHIDRNPLNNRADNLRLVTNAENCQNQTARVTSRTGIKGVYIDSHSKSNRYAAAIQVNGKRIHLGRFKTLPEAAEVVRVATLKYHTHSPYHQGLSASAG